MEEQGIRVPYLFGTMIEVPRAALTADELAEVAQFFSYGTNDLTQTTYGISRDDAEKGFLIRYLEEEILEDNPFATSTRGASASSSRSAPPSAAGPGRTWRSASAASTAATRAPSRSATAPASTTSAARRSACPSRASPRPHAALDLLRGPQVVRARWRNIGSVSPRLRGLSPGRCR
jgi:uncharacterized membrane protein